MKRPGAVRVVMPASVDDPARPSGGNVYDRHVCDELVALGWQVREHRVPGGWPRPSARDEASLRRVLDQIPSGASVLVDGLIGCATRTVAQHADRLRLVMLVHMPLAESGHAGSERAALTAVDAVITTSRWARRWLCEHHGVAADRVHVIEPGVEPGETAAATPGGDRMLCVAAVTPEKGHHTLVAALQAVRDLDWHCTCVGALDIDPRFAARLRVAVRRAGLADRITFPGPLSRGALEAIRAETDLAVSASRRESYGMATTEALARGIPVVATAVGGQPEAVGSAEGIVPGLIVPPHDADALADALRRWLRDGRLRERLRRAAVCRAAQLATWPAVADRLAAVVTEGEPGPLRDRVPGMARAGTRR